MSNNTGILNKLPDIHTMEHEANSEMRNLISDYEMMPTVYC